jgi:hypothetical protein
LEGNDTVNERNFIQFGRENGMEKEGKNIGFDHVIKA